MSAAWETAVIGPDRVQLSDYECRAIRAWYNAGARVDIIADLVRRPPGTVKSALRLFRSLKLVGFRDGKDDLNGAV